MSELLFAWLGNTDLRASHGEPDAGLGPIGQAVQAATYDLVVLLSDHPKDTGESYRKWLRTRCKSEIQVVPAKLTSPTHFGEIYENAVGAILGIVPKAAAPANLTFHLSPGTPAMAAVWIILAKTRFPATLIESSQKFGVKVASVPFDISADYLPDLLRKPDEDLIRLTQGLPPEAPEFASIIHRCAAMKRLIAKARRVAPRNLPVLLFGESGTGKELFARAIHRSSPRKDAPFVAVNCGAIPAELVESELFGHEKGAFTGATAARRGHIESASTGTLFLDEIGELPLPAQVKLLRVLQEGELIRVGASHPTKVDIRVIAATNRNLVEEMALGRFREDLFHRIAVAVLQIPPLRDRKGDLGPLIDHFLERINEEAKGQPGHEHKKLSASARSLLLSHPWPGNVRELINTLQRAVVWSSSATIGPEDVREAILPLPLEPKQEILNRSLGEGLDLQELLSQVARHYLTRALEESAGNKTQAAELVGLPSYQTLTNWLKRYGVPE